jgi:purine-binding chemotaxis protein CheW
VSEPRRLDWDAARERLRAAQSALETGASPQAEEIARVYRERAVLFAQLLEQQGEEKAGRLLIFHVDSSRFGVVAGDVAEVIRQPKTTPVPGSPAIIAGLISVRGEIRPVLRLLVALGLPEGVGQARLVILLRHGSRTLGISVDQVDEVIPIDSEDRRPVSSIDLPGSWLTADYTTVLDTKSLFEKLQDRSPL